MVTIDPARRLATALGLESWATSPGASTPRPSPPPACRSRRAVGDDARRQAHLRRAHRAPGPRRKARDEVLSNRIYQELSAAVAGSQEFTAIAKLYELDREGDFDVIVLDTPPSRNALDFLDAPDRLTGFFEGRALQVFLAPGGLTARLFGRGTGLVFSIFARVTGVDLLGDLSRLLSLAGRPHRRVSRARPRRGGAPARPRHHVPDRHLARARAGRGGDLLRRQAGGGGDALRRADRQPRAPRWPRRPLDRGGRGAARRSWATGCAGWRATWPTSTCSSGATARRSPACRARSARATRARASPR